MPVSQHLRVAAPYLLVMAGACTAGSLADPHREMPKEQFAALFTLGDTVVLEQPDSAPLVRISGFAVSSQGLFAIGDVSEGNVKLYGATGRLLRVLGRKGSGPLEFEEPRGVRFDASRNLHVADYTLHKVNVYDTAGALVRTVVLPGYSFISDFAVLPSGDYLLATPTSGGDSVLHRIGGDGRVIRGYLPVGSVLPTGGSSIPEWKNVRQFWVGTMGDQVLVAATISDTVWTVDMQTGSVKASHLSFGGYAPPRPPPAPLRNVRELREWARGLQVAGSIVAANNSVAINFVRGILHFGDPNTLLLRIDGGEWQALSNSPPILAATAQGTLIALHNPHDSASANVVLAQYIPAR